MLKHAKVGLIVWGCILLLGSLIALIAMYDSFSYGDGGVAAFVILIILIMLGGAIMLVFGIVSTVKASNYNREILNRNVIYYGFCPHCGTRLDYTIKDFRPHGRYPEGFAYCKVCKKPVSRNAFHPVINFY